MIDGNLCSSINDNYAPIVVFVYNRPRHITKLLESLSCCKLSKSSELFIFSDASKDERNKDRVLEVRAIICDKKWESFFKKITIIKAEKNKGLANSIISGVTDIIHRFGKVIVVEDDNIVAPDFLDFMNRALTFYNENDSIGYIGGYTVPIHIPEDYQYDVFAMGRGSSYAWATWQKYWDKVDWDVSDYDIFKKDKKLKKRFNEYGPDRTRLLESQMLGKIDSWAIRFSYSMFKMNKIAILPVKTRVENIGFDDSGVHNKSIEKKFLTTIEPNLKPVTFCNVTIDERIKKEYYKIFKKPPILKRLIRRIKNCF